MASNVPGSVAKDAHGAVEGRGRASPRVSRASPLSRDARDSPRGPRSQHIPDIGYSVYRRRLFGVTKASTSVWETMDRQVGGRQSGRDQITNGPRGRENIQTTPRLPSGQTGR